MAFAKKSKVLAPVVVLQRIYL